MGHGGMSRRPPPAGTGTIVIISDRVEHCPQALQCHADEQLAGADLDASVVVEGGYLERLPLALIAAGRFATAEIWHHATGTSHCTAVRHSSRLVRRTFPLDQPQAPFDNAAMARHLRDHGPPDLLVVYGLGVSEEVLAAAEGAVIVYNSIDAPSLRVPFEVSRHFDVVLAGAQWQADEIRARHPETPAPILPVGPEFAATDQLRPLHGEKDYDLVYVAAAQPYKRHDILFDAVERLAGRVRALCVFGYGELAEPYRQEIAARALPIDCVMPPVVPFDEVNRLMNRAKIGIVAGIDDGAPAIITEYMLAGLPVLANSDLRCGLQYFLPGTGEIAAAGDWPGAIEAMLARIETYRPREIALARWSWPVTAARFFSIYDDARHSKTGRHNNLACEKVSPC